MGLSSCLCNFKVRPRIYGEIIWSADLLHYLKLLGPNFMPWNLYCLWDFTIGLISYMIGFNIILGMNFLSPYYVTHNFSTKSMTLEILETERLEWEELYNPKKANIISFIQAINLVKKGS